MTHFPQGTSAPNDFDDDLALLADLLDAQGIGREDPQGVRPRGANVPVPMSFSQELLWMLDRATPGMVAYNMPVARRIIGPLDVRALNDALSILAERHESLRTRFAEVEGEPRLIIDAPAPVAVHTVDLSSLDETNREGAAIQVVRQRAAAPFDLEHEHMFRATLVRLAAEEHILVLELHHIVADGWSLGVLNRELSEAYAAYKRGSPPELRPVCVQFGDFALWQREQLAGERLHALLEFWRGHLGPVSEPLGLPTDFARASAPTFAGARETITIESDRLESIKRLASAHGATLYMVLLAAYAAVLHRYTGRRDVLIGSGSAGRSVPETEGLVGYLNNTLVQRADFSDNPTFETLLARVRAGAIAAYDHQDIPLEKLVMELRQGAERLQNAPLFEVVLTMQDTLGVPLALDGLDVVPLPVDIGATKFDMTLFASEREGALRLTVQYRSDLFAAATMQRFLGHLGTLLDGAAANADVPVSRLPLTTAHEQRQLTQWNDTRIDDGAETTIVALFNAQVGRVPERIAVRAHDGALTYAELDVGARRVAAALRAHGVGRDTPVAVGADRSAAAIAAILGVLQAGGCYVPIPHSLPDERRAQILRESGARVAVTTSDDAEAACFDSVQVVRLDELPDEPSDGGVDVEEATPSSLAYVLFTSGSTGVPKGVAITHANLISYVRGVARSLSQRPKIDDACAALDGLEFGMVTTLAADLGNTALFGALLNGGTLHVLPQGIATDPVLFADYVAAFPLDVLKITPGHVAALIAGHPAGALRSILPRRVLVLGGEALRPALALRLLAGGACRVLNHYGPTESTVGACTFEVSAESLEKAREAGAATVPIGSPIANMAARVVDRFDNELPVGIPGELLLTGAAVAAGYLGRPELTSARFTTTVSGNETVRGYRTGDRVRRLSDGRLEYLGRVDDQVKVRGYRVELGEVEHAILAHPGVAEATVVVDGDDADVRIVAYVAPRTSGYAASHGERVTADAILERLRTSLPEYMVPGALTVVDALPRTANGKVDRRALPAIGFAAAGESQSAPTTATEIELAGIWCDVLKKERVSVADNFLALGGHSLLAIRVLGRISRAFGVRLPLRSLFDAPTIAQLATIVEAEVSSAPVSSGSISSRSRDAYRLDPSRVTTPAQPLRGES